MRKREEELAGDHVFDERLLRVRAGSHDRMRAKDAGRQERLDDEAVAEALEYHRDVLAGAAEAANFRRQQCADQAEVGEFRPGLTVEAIIQLGVRVPLLDIVAVSDETARGVGEHLAFFGKFKVHGFRSRCCSSLRSGTSAGAGQWPGSRLLSDSAVVHI